MVMAAVPPPMIVPAPPVVAKIPCVPLSVTAIV
jgi:hypothetical protein